MDPRLQPGFLGTGASLMSDLSLLAYILLIVPGMLLGFWFARRGKHRPHHKWTMIFITAVNWVLILFLMVVSYTADVDDNIVRQPNNMRYLIPTVHALFGLPAQLLATYIVYRMLREDTQVAAAKRRGVTGRALERYWFNNAKPFMRLTITLWLVTAAFGVITYLVRYEVMPALSLGADDPPAATPELTPEATSEATAEMPNAPAATPEVPDPAETPEADEVLEANSPVQTPEVASTSRPMRTPRTVSPAQTPEVRAPVLTPEVVPDPDPEPEDDDDSRDDSGGMGMGSD
jgi:uncharacterized membrane protein YozB (DUF420 family)